MPVSENELREILKIIRQLERVLEQALRSEQEKNEERVKKQLKSQGIQVSDSEDKVSFIIDEDTECDCQGDILDPHDPSCIFAQSRSEDNFEL